MSAPESAAGPLSAALTYAARGWFVFPTHSIQDGRCTCRRDCTSPGKHPVLQHGLTEATVDEAVLRGWWERWPFANVAIRTGSASGIVVLDIDPHHGGDDGLAELERRYDSLPHTVLALTGGGGAHYYFAHAGSELRNTVELAGQPGVDFRGEGGYVLAPPSRHLSGEPYLWELTSHPDDTTLASVPSWLYALLTGKRRARGAAAGTALEVPARIGEGGRNQALASLAGSMRRRGLSEVEIAAALSAVNKERCDPPLDDDEVRGIAASIARYAPVVPITGRGHVAHEIPPPPDTPPDEADAPGAPQPAQARPVRFRLYTIAELRELPPPAELVDGVVSQDVFATLWGPSGHGKSLLALDLALSLAAGIPWHGHDVEQGPAILVCAEGASAVSLRVNAWLAHRECRDPEGFYAITEAVNLFVAGEPEALVDSVASFSVAPRLVIYDTLARSMVGGDENSARDMGVVIAAADAVRAQIGGTSLVIHHSGRDGEHERGSTALFGASDSVFSAIRDDEGVLKFQSRKQKDRADFDPISFEIRSVAESVVLVPAGEMRPQRDRPPATAASVLAQIWRAFGPDQASVTQVSQVCDVPKRSLFWSLRWLAEEGLIRKDRAGRSTLYTVTDRGQELLT